MKIFQKFGIPNVFDAIITDESNKKEKFDQFIDEQGIVNGIIIGDLQFDLDLGLSYNFNTIRGHPKGKGERMYDFLTENIKTVCGKNTLSECQLPGGYE